MTTNAFGQQNSVRQACGRLAGAVFRLEEAVDTALATTHSQHDSDLKAAQAEARALRDAHKTVAERLDVAIARLRAIVGE